jgi:CTP synthase
VISAPDVKSIYEVPVNFERDNLGNLILSKLKIKTRKQDLKNWRKLAKSVKESKKSVKIGIVGKYFGSGEFVLADSYISVIEAIKHAAYYFNRQPIIQWLNAEEFEESLKNLEKLKEYGGVIVPGGFGSRGVEGKISVIRYLRENKIPFLGLCYGMQLATIEFARNVAGFKKANTAEVAPETPYPVIDILPEQKQKLAKKDYGASMRLGAYPAVLKKGTIAYRSYKSNKTNKSNKSDKTNKTYKFNKSNKTDELIFERHRHRYEINPEYIERLEKKGLIFSGFSSDRRLMEILELPKEKHPFFVATQFHPEFKSRPLKPHPLFREFIRAAQQKD